MKNHLRWPLLVLSAAAALCLVFLASCQTASPPASPPIEPPVGSFRAPAPEAFTETADLRRTSLATFRIASFNIANLSAKNLAKSGVGPELALIFRRYDLIAVQEVTGASTDSVDALLTFINQRPGPEYRFLVSPYSGTLATAGQKEKYAFFYNSSTVTPLSAGVLYPDPLNVFVREPFAAQFRANGSPESFVLLNFHAEADKQGVSREIPALGPASAWAADHFTGELGVIILGDFNAVVTYISPAELAPLRAAALPFLWIVPDSADTTFEDGKYTQAHDRIVVRGDPLIRRYTSRWGVDRIMSSKKVSDHFPVWAEFSFAGKNQFPSSLPSHRALCSALLALARAVCGPATTAFVRAFAAVGDGFGSALTAGSRDASPKLDPSRGRSLARAPARDTAGLAALPPSPTPSSAHPLLTPSSRSRIRGGRSPAGFFRLL